MKDHLPAQWWSGQRADCCARRSTPVNSAAGEHPRGSGTSTVPGGTGASAGSRRRSPTGFDDIASGSARWRDATGTGVSRAGPCRRLAVVREDGPCEGSAPNQASVAAEYSPVDATSLAAQHPVATPGCRRPEERPVKTARSARRVGLQHLRSTGGLVTRPGTGEHRRSGGAGAYPKATTGIIFRPSVGGASNARRGSAARCGARRQRGRRPHRCRAGPPCGVNEPHELWGPAAVTAAEAAVVKTSRLPRQHVTQTSGSGRSARPPPSHLRRPESKSTRPVTPQYRSARLKQRMRGLGPCRAVRMTVGSGRVSVIASGGWSPERCRLQRHPAGIELASSPPL